MAKASPAAKIRPKSTYTTEQRAAALAQLTANNGNLLRTSRDTGIPRQTLQNWANEETPLDAETQNIRHQKRGELADELKNLAYLAVDRASDPEAIAKASALDAAKIAGIAIDKFQLLTGQPTTITEERTIDSRQVLLLLGEFLDDQIAAERNVTPAAAQLTP